MEKWDGLFVPEPILRGLKDLEFMAPTPIQALTLPSAIRDGLDILGAAETGSGKTLAFGIPILNGILEERASREKNKKGKSEGETTSKDDQEDSDDDDSDGEEDDGVRIIGDDEEGCSDDEDDAEAGSASEDDSEEDGEPTGFSDEDDSDDDDGDGDCNRAPDEENIPELQDNQFGCVKVLNNVTFDWLNEDKEKKCSTNPIYALILSPTRELAVQIKRHIDKAAIHCNVKTALIFGGLAVQKQTRILRQGPDIIIATPGRLWELMAQGDTCLRSLPDIRMLVVDEADRMVEKGHFAEMEKIISQINGDEEARKRRQNFIFSATLTFVHSAPSRFKKKRNKKKKLPGSAEEKLSQLVEQIGLTSKPKVINLTSESITASALVESCITCSAQEKDLYLFYFLKSFPARTLIFTNSIDCIRRLVSIFTLLLPTSRPPLPLHAGMHQKQRLKNLERFTAEKLSVLIATDVAARGLDIPGVEHVIHYQVPRTTESYVHRSGRTARASQDGLSIMLVAPGDSAKYRKIVRTLNKDSDLSAFPVERDLLIPVRERVDLARDIDREQYRLGKKKRSNDWFVKAAEEAGIELDENDHLLNDLGDSYEQKNSQNRLKGMKKQLAALLRQSLSVRSFSGKYPTMSGKLVVPEMMVRGRATDVATQEKNKETLLKKAIPRKRKAKAFKGFNSKKKKKKVAAE